MSFVQSVGKVSFTGASNVAPVTITAGANFGAFNLVIVGVEFFAATSTNTTGVTVAGTAATRRKGIQTSTATQGEIWDTTSNAGGSAAAVISFGTGGHDGFASLLEWSNVSAVDTGTENGNAQAASTAPTVSTLVPTAQTDELLFGVSASGSVGTSTYTQPSGWTGLGAENNGASNNAGAIAYFEDTGAAGTKTATWAQTDNTTSDNVIAAYKLTPAGANDLSNDYGGEDPKQYDGDDELDTSDDYDNTDPDRPWSDMDHWSEEDYDHHEGGTDPDRAIILNPDLPQSFEAEWADEDYDDHDESVDARPLVFVAVDIAQSYDAEDSEEGYDAHEGGTDALPLPGNDNNIPFSYFAEDAEDDYDSHDGNTDALFIALTGTLMPNVVGMLWEQATRVLIEAGIVPNDGMVAGPYINEGYFDFWPVSLRWLPMPGMPSGIVTAQSLAAGLQVAFNTHLVLTVSNFPFGVSDRYSAGGYS